MGTGTVKEMQSTNILPSQLRLAEVIEMIHVATVCHQSSYRCTSVSNSRVTFSYYTTT